MYLFLRLRVELIIMSPSWVIEEYLVFLIGLMISLELLVEQGVQ